MSISILTKEDLQQFKEELFHEIKTLLISVKSDEKKWLRTSEVKKLLNVSSGTLQSLRNSGILSHSKIGGSLFYNRDEIEMLMKKTVIK